MKPSSSLPVIGITMGDPVGVGPEIIAKAFAERELFSWCRPVVYGDPALLQREIDTLGLSLTISKDASASAPGTMGIIDLSALEPGRVVYGKPTVESGKAMAQYIIAAVEAVQTGSIDAIVTAPINKESLHQAGYTFPGHTEMLADLTGTPDVVMMLAGDKLRVVLVTIHCALADVPKRLSTDGIVKTLSITYRSLQNYFGLPSPRIAVAALNPHAGEGGLFGNEEKDLIIPAMQLAEKEGIPAAGPYPPDTVFYQAARGHFDAVVCMYHDQGLIPLKLLHFEDGVNVTLGLPIIRTSVDHGTAYDIAGQGRANPASLLAAVKTASEMASCRP